MNSEANERGIHIAIKRERQSRGVQHAGATGQKGVTLSERFAAVAEARQNQTPKEESPFPLLDSFM